MQITILPPPSDLYLEPQQENATPADMANAQGRFECPDIECGAVFSYRRVSCGHFVPPNFCPMCGGPMDAAEHQPDNGQALILEASDYSSENLSGWRQLRSQQLPQLLG